MIDFPFYVEDLTINDGSLALGESKEFDIKMGCNWAKVRQVKLVQLSEGPMNVTFELWEKDSSGYDSADRSTFYLRNLRRTIVQTPEQGAEFLEILNPELLYFDRDKSGELHCRIMNHDGGTASDFAIIIKCAEVGESL